MRSRSQHFSFLGLLQTGMASALLDLGVTKWRPKTGMILTLFSIFLSSESIFSMLNNHPLHYCGLFISSYITTIQQHGRSYKLQDEFQLTKLPVDAKSDSGPLDLILGKRMDKSNRKFKMLYKRIKDNTSGRRFREKEIRRMSQK